jgi:hypothetical protein
MVLKVASLSPSATSILQTYILVYGYSGGPWVNNTQVTHLDLSMGDSTAIMELQLGRTPVQSAPSTGFGATYFDAVGSSISGGNSSGFTSTTSSITQSLGIYYVHGGAILQLNFSTPVESFAITEDWAFALSVRLVGATASTADGECHINAWFSEA